MCPHSRHSTLPLSTPHKAAYFESGWVSEEDVEKEKKRKEGGGFKFW